MMGVQQIGFAPMPAVAAILSRYDRGQLEAFIAVAIDLIDVADGDPDLEADDRGGETVALIDDPDDPPEDDGIDPDLEEVPTEDAFASHHGIGAGCPVSDPGGGAADDEGEPDDDAQGDTSWTEWHTRGRHKQDEFGSENRTAIGHCQTAHEDDEDDDADEEHDGREEDPDIEVEQMFGDVPSLAVFALEPDPSTGRRACLGLSNLTTSFFANGGVVRSADSGKVVRLGRPTELGVPV